MKRIMYVARALVWLLCACAAGAWQSAGAAEELINSARMASGEEVPYILTSRTPDPLYLLILFPGGSGRMDPRMENGRLVFALKGNFLIRSRHLMVDDAFATVSTNSTESEERMQALLDDLKRRFPKAKIYLIGTSNGTFATMALSGYLSERIAGVIHTSSRNPIAFLDAGKYRNRHLIVHHKNDPCPHTSFTSARRAHDKYGTPLIVMEGGQSTGDPCEAFSHHGYNGIETDTVAAIKKWILQGEAAGAPR